MTMNEEAHFIDANVPMYAVGADSALKAPCLRILEASGRGTLAAVTDSEVIQEILHRYAAIGQRIRAVEVARLFIQVVPSVLAVGKPDVEAAASLLLERDTLSVRDAVHLAVMGRQGVARIISADRHFDGLPGVARIDPMAWGR